MSRRLVLLVLLSGCGGPNQPVPVIGASPDIASLEGEWDGWYRADVSDRHGSIDFHLRAGADTALGDVVMVPEGWRDPVKPARSTAVESGDVAPAPSLLRIRFVRVSNGQVSGQLEPYQDPECGCELTATFTGRLSGDSLSGRYTTIHAHGGPAVAGKWGAVRTRR
jgi:hypothetical protein